MPIENLWIGTSWKMNKLRADARAFAEALTASAAAHRDAPVLFIIPPFTVVAEVAAMLGGTRVKVGVQNIHWAEAGAWTGEISAGMARDAGATLAEIGHSERRTHFGETDETVALKVEAALRHGLTPLVCVGDTRAEHDADRTAEVLERQVRAALSRVSPAEAERVVIAYEPVWSIGEGGTPAEPRFADAQHALIKQTLRALTGSEPRVLYGGSVNPANCSALAGCPHIDGLFIGRSAWQPADFLGIVAQVAGS